MPRSHSASLFDDLKERHPRSLQGALEAREVSPQKFDQISEMFLGWAIGALGESGMPRLLDAFVRFTYEVNHAQALYEEQQRYLHSSFAECEQQFYSQDEFMDDYLWGIYLTNFLWVHHFEICLFYFDRFLRRLPPDARLLEIAPGHGGWGVWALSVLESSQLEGFDLSPRSIQIAGSLAAAAGVDDRATYRQLDALRLGEREAGTADGCVCCFLVEHLEDPCGLFAAIRRQLKPGARAFITGALTAAQVDHIYEFRRESELVAMSEQNGLRVLETFSGNPRRTLPGARYVPRSMALIVTACKNEYC